MQITEDTKISEILDKYGDISEVMVPLGITSVKGNKLRHFLGSKLTVKWAAKFHRVPLDEFLELLNKGISGIKTEPLQE